MKGKFATDNADLFLSNLKYLMQQTKTMFSGEITQQIIKDIPCEAIKVESEKSEQTEVVKEIELNETEDTFVNEEVTEPLSQETEK